MANLDVSSTTTQRFRPLQPPAELLSFVERQIRTAHSYAGAERRMKQRYLIAVPVTVQPLDRRLKPVGDPFPAVTRDISPTGIGVVHVEPLKPQLLALGMEIADEQVNLVVEVLWCRGIGPFFYSGGDFIKRLKRLPGQGDEGPALPVVP